MTGTGPAAAISFLVETLFDFYSYIILARLILQLVKADFYNPIAQFVVKATNPLLIPLRRVIPGFAGIDNAAIVLLVTIQLLKWLIIGLVVHGAVFNGVQLIISTLVGIVSLFIGFFLFAIFIQVIISWIAPGVYNPITQVIHDIAEPLLAPARKLLPPLGGLDLSPMLVILALVFIKILFGI